MLNEDLGNRPKRFDPISRQAERPLAFGPDPGNPIGYDYSMAKGSRSVVCQRTMGQYPLPGYGPVASENRPVRTRMPGGVGRGREILPLTRLCQITCSFVQTARKAFCERCNHLSIRFRLFSTILPASFCLHSIA